MKYDVTLVYPGSPAKHVTRLSNVNITQSTRSTIRVESDETRAGLAAFGDLLSAHAVAAEPDAPWLLDPDGDVWKRSEEAPHSYEFVECRCADGGCEIDGYVEDASLVLSSYGPVVEYDEYPARLEVRDGPTPGGDPSDEWMFPAGTLIAWYSSPQPDKDMTLVSSAKSRWSGNPRVLPILPRWVDDMPEGYDSWESVMGDVFRGHAKKALLRELALQAATALACAPKGTRA